MAHHDITGSEFAGCPECGAPAEITARFVLESTDGPLEHVTVRCVATLAHRYTMLLERLAADHIPSGKGAERWTSVPRSN